MMLEVGPNRSKFSSFFFREEVQIYKATPLVDMDVDPLTWWQERERDFPRLAELARKYLCIQASSTL